MQRATFCASTPRKTGDDLYFDLTGNGGRQIVHIETVGDNYEFSYMGGALKMHTTKAFVAERRARKRSQEADGVSTDGFVFEGDTHALDEMLQLPEVRSCRRCRARSVFAASPAARFPASLALHKTARQSAEALGIDVEPLDTAQSQTAATAGVSELGQPVLRHVRLRLQLLVLGVRRLLLSLGCAEHDAWCRQGQWYYCYNITAVIALFGC